MFNMKIVEKQITKAYEYLMDDTNFFDWDINTFICFFRIFYEKYMYYMRKYPPKLTTEKYIEILPKIPLDDNDEMYCLDEYEEMIDKYFESQFDSNFYEHSLLHFLSGDIRYYKYCECFGCGNSDWEIVNEKRGIGYRYEY